MNEWHSFGDTWDAFERAGLAQAGVVIDVEGKLLLIGDIDLYGGMCGHCLPWVDGEVIVRRYKHLIEKRLIS